MSKTTWNPIKQEEEFFKSIILPLSVAMLKQHGTFENAIRSNPILLQNMHAAINKSPAHSSQIQWVAQQDQSISLSQLEDWTLDKFPPYLVITLVPITETCINQILLCS